MRLDTTLLLPVTLRQVKKAKTLKSRTTEIRRRVREIDKFGQRIKTTYIRPEPHLTSVQEYSRRPAQRGSMY